MKSATKMMALALLVMVGAMAAAQMTTSDRIAAQMPFKFMVADKYVPAGECILQRADLSNRVLIIRNVEGKVNMFVPFALGSSANPSSHYALVFNTYGNLHFLAAVRIEGTSEIYKVPQGKAELELRAQNVQPVQEVLLASRR
jgi:hypothetical protein